MFLLLLLLWPVKGKEVRSHLAGPEVTFRHKNYLFSLPITEISEKFPLFPLLSLDRARPALSEYRIRTIKSGPIYETATYENSLMYWIDKAVPAD